MRKLGRFYVQKEFIRRRWRDLMPMMANMVVVETVFRWETDTMEYLAYSELFDEVQEAVAAPWYDIVVDENVIPASIRAVRCSGKDAWR